MSKKFIPNGDLDFVTMAQSFARNVASDPARFFVSNDESAALTSAVEQFQATFRKARFGARSQVATAEKEQARQVVEKIIRRIAHGVRVSDKIDAASKVLLGLRERTERPKVLTVPNEAPQLRFVRAVHVGGGVLPEHELVFTSKDFKARPAGAVRLELFVDLVAPDAMIPEFPGAVRGSRPFYVRSFTRSPIRFTPPMAKVPMRVVYWARWADTMGNVGPFSNTAAGWVEGGWNAPMEIGSFGKSKLQMIEVNDEAHALERETTVVVALFEAMQQNGTGQRAGYASHEAMSELAQPEQRDAKQLEGPVAEAA